MTNVDRVALFVVDGMRPDGLRQAHTPVIDGLIASGAHTFALRTVMPSITLPCHASLFLGVLPERHGITTNTWTPARPIPGLIDVIHQAGKTTASFFNWEELRDLSRPGSLDVSFYLNNHWVADGVGDSELAELAAGWLSQSTADFVFVYLGHTDMAGHAHGWMSGPYLEAIANADRCIGRVLEALPQSSAIVVTSDHGGHDHEHGTEHDEDMIVPFIVSGAPGIPAGHTIERPVSITDIAPTVTRLLGLTPPTEWTGRAIEFA